MGAILLEREAPLAAAAEALAQAARGHGGLLALVGEAGTGKTSVLGAVAGAAGPAFTCARACGEEMETGIPFGALAQLLAALDGSSPAAARGDGPGEDVGGPVLERSVPFVRALARLRGRATAGPLLVLLDDLHWFDADSLDAVGFLARRMADLPILLVAGLRPWPAAAADLVASLVAGGHAQTLDLAPLSPAAGRALLRDAAGAPVSDAVARRAWAWAAGNPLLTRHVGVALAAGEDPFVGERSAQRLLTARFAGLDADVLQLARTASVLGATFAPHVAAALSGLGPDAAASSLEALTRSGLVGEDGPGQLRFVHPLLRQALHDGLAPAARQRLHAAAYAELARRGRSADAAEHAIRAGLTGDADAAALLERVGRAGLAAGAVVAGARHLEAAARVLGDDAAPSLLLALAEALIAAGRPADGAVRCREVLTRPDLPWDVRVQALMLLGRCGYLTGEPDRGAAATGYAVALAEQHDPVAAIEPLLEQVVSTWVTSGPGWALPLAERARRIAAGHAVDPLLRERVEADWGGLAVEAGNPEGIAATQPVARWIGSTSPAHLLATSDLVSPLSVLYPYAHSAMYAERFDDAAAALAFAATRLEAAGAADATATVRLFQANLLLRRGRLADALGVLADAGRFAEFTPFVTPAVAGLRALVLTWAGRDAEAADARREARAAGGLWQLAAWDAWGRGLAALWAGDPGASDAFLEIERLLHDARVREPGQTPFHTHAVEAHLLAGRREDARRVVRELAPVAAQHPARWPRFAVALGHARLHAHGGEADAASAGFTAALDVLGDADLPLARTEALLAAGAHARRTGRAVQARPALAEAARTAEAHGALAVARVARDELRLAGGRRRRDDADRDRLTAAERRVARAAAAGHSNAEIAASLHLSSNTVATHLRRVYAKLGIAGRGRLGSVDLEEA